MGDGDRTRINPRLCLTAQDQRIQSNHRGVGQCVEGVHAGDVRGIVDVLGVDHDQPGTGILREDAQSIGIQDHGLGSVRVGNARRTLTKESLEPGNTNQSRCGSCVSFRHRRLTVTHAIEAEGHGAWRVRVENGLVVMECGREVGEIDSAVRKTQSHVQIQVGFRRDGKLGVDVRQRIHRQSSVGPAGQVQIERAEQPARQSVVARDSESVGGVHRHIGHHRFQHAEVALKLGSAHGGVEIEDELAARRADAIRDQIHAVVGVEPESESEEIMQLQGQGSIQIQVQAGHLQAQWNLLLEHRVPDQGAELDAIGVGDQPDFVRVADRFINDLAALIVEPLRDQSIPQHVKQSVTNDVERGLALRDPGCECGMQSGLFRIRIVIPDQKVLKIGDEPGSVPERRAHQW